MTTIEMEIVGTRGLLHHGRNVNKEFGEIVLGPQRSKTPTTLAEFKQEAINGMYADEKGKPYVPASNVEGCFVDAGKSFQIRGKGKKTYKGAMMSAIRVFPDRLYISPTDWTVDIRQARIKGIRVFRARALFKEGWKTSLSIELLDKNLAPEEVRGIAEYAGKYVGLCDFRPKFGLFEIKSWKVK